MKKSTSAVNRWEQLSLSPPPVIEITLRIGLMTETGHCQAQIEAHDATQGVLVAMLSWPHFEMSDIEDRMRDVGRELTQLIRQHSSPFPT